MQKYYFINWIYQLLIFPNSFEIILLHFDIKLCFAHLPFPENYLSNRKTVLFLDFDKRFVLFLTPQALYREPVAMYCTDL